MRINQRRHQATKQTTQSLLSIFLRQRHSYARPIYGAKNLRLRSYCSQTNYTLTFKWGSCTTGPFKEKDRELRCRVREKLKGNRLIRIGLSPISQAKESQSGPPKGRWEVEGAGGVLTYAGCVEGLQACCQGVQGWGTMGHGAGGRSWLVH